MRYLKRLLLAASFFAAVGCGMGGKPTGQVSGTVQLSGQPVTGGNVNFYLKDKGVGAVASLDPSGKYAFATPLEPGTYTVYLTPPPPEPVPPGTRVARAAQTIPRKYQDPATSNLTYTVMSGKNEFPIALGN